MGVHRISVIAPLGVQHFGHACDVWTPRTHPVTAHHDRMMSDRKTGLPG